MFGAPEAPLEGMLQMTADEWVPFRDIAPILIHSLLPCPTPIHERCECMMTPSMKNAGIDMRADYIIAIKVEIEPCYSYFYKSKNLYQLVVRRINTAMPLPTSDDWPKVLAQLEQFCAFLGVCLFLAVHLFGHLHRRSFGFRELKGVEYSSITDSRHYFHGRGYEEEFNFPKEFKWEQKNQQNDEYLTRFWYVPSTANCEYGTKQFFNPGPAPRLASTASIPASVAPRPPMLRESNIRFYPVEQTTIACDRSCYSDCSVM